MSEETNIAVPIGRSWREIRQEVTPRAMSRRGRRRQQMEWIKATVLCAIAGGIAWMVFTVMHSWETDRAGLAAAVKSERVRGITLDTDGMLPKQWVESVLALPPRATLMELDLPQLRDRLAAQGQVRVAVVSRAFPDTLAVTLKERTPVARVQVEDSAGTPKQLFVAKDGVVYEGVNYDKQMVASLPWLDGIKLTRAGNGYAPVPGMEDVANLLTTAQLQAPHLYRGWMIVSLARLADRNEIVVKSQDIAEIVFSRKEDFFKQLAQLDYIFDTVTAQTQGLPPPVVQSVNLALGGQVPVKLALSPEQLAKQKHSSDLISQPPSSRKGPRDL
ncbi:MAG TPA: FtsQ-type POTRA domain-containing protein [Candidatus Didemnitutus sp.]|nr:FtsQ-type POTRA domain-containing protein [Candidatus Didemnitutus sp.]